MRITTVNDKRIPLQDVRDGAILKYNNDYYMKLEYQYAEYFPQYDNGERPTVVDLKDGSLACFIDTTLVEVVDAELRIKE